MSRFFDARLMKGFDKNILKDLQTSPEYEFKGISTYTIIRKLIDCLQEAPNLEAVRKNHEKLGIKCDRITGVKTTA